MSERENFFRPKKGNLEDDKLPQSEEAARAGKEEDEKITNEINLLLKKGSVPKNLAFYSERFEEKYKVMRKARILEGPDELLNLGEKDYYAIEPVLHDGYIKIGNFRSALNVLEVKNLAELIKICENKEFVKILRADLNNFHYLVENKIINRHNFFRLNEETIENLNKIRDIHIPAREEEVDFFKKLLNKYPRAAANTLIAAETSKSINIIKDEKDIFEALEKIGAVTPFIFEKFKKLGPKERDAFAAEIKRAKKNLFKNNPIETKGREDEVAELIYIAFKPIGMDYKKVREFIPQLEDRTRDLKDYKFPEDGYEITLIPPAEKTLKQGKEIDYKKIDGVMASLRLSHKAVAEGEGKELGERMFSILNKLAKASPQIERDETSHLLGLLFNRNFDDFVIKDLPKEKEVNRLYAYLSEAKEIFGVIFKDNFLLDLKNFLQVQEFYSIGQKNADIEKIKETLKNHKTAFLKALGKEFKNEEFAKDEYWQNLDTGKIAQLLSVFFDEKVISRLRRDINEELNKFQDKEQGAASKKKREKSKKKLKAYISKNIASFFAKASAGICTAEDIETFNRSDHFHINLAEEVGEDGDETARGNNQAYIIEDGDKKSLLLRGINPNSDFLYGVDAKLLCEEILKVAKKFRGDNDMKNIYLSEKLSSWHALSNRPPVVEYLENKYLRQRNEKNFEFEIVSGQKISKIYKVY